MNKKILIPMTLLFAGIIGLCVYLYTSSKQELEYKEYVNEETVSVNVITIEGIVDRLRNTDEDTKARLYKAISDLSLTEGTLIDNVPSNEDYYSDIIYSLDNTYDGSMYWTFNTGGTTYIFFEVDGIFRHVVYTE